MSPEKNLSSPSLPPPVSSSITTTSSPSPTDVVVSGCTTASSLTSTIASSVVTPLLHSKNTTEGGETVDLSFQQADNNNNNSSSNNRADNNTTTSNGTSSGGSPPSSRVDDCTSTSPHLHNSNRTTDGSRSTSSPNPNSQPSTNRTIVSSSSHLAQTTAGTPSSVLVSQQQPSSVIQSNHQSVIQSGVQLGQLISRNDLASKVASFSSPEDESKKRREVLERRPSYRKILNDLSSAEVSAIAAQFNQNLQQQHLLQEIKSEPDQHPPSSHHPSQHPSVVNLNGSSSVSSISSSSSLGVISPPSAILSAASSPYLKVVSASTIQLAPGSQELGSLSALTVNTGSASGEGGGGGGGGGAGGHPTSSIVQYAHGGQDGQSFFVPVSAYPNGGHFHSPVTVSPDMSAYQLSGRSSGLSPGVMNLSPNTGPPQVEEASKKREFRLLKNRIAAKECRRKKKEYIKCLENRVAVLENQNKALIEELKALKELYCCSKGD